MKALILVGGYGLRLRPLTLTRPKPLVEFCNEPIMFRQMNSLIESGVKKIILAINYMSEMLEERIHKFIQNKDVEVVFSKESEPLGTAGPLALAKEHLSGDEPFFMLNSDVITVFPFKEMMEFHKSSPREATMAVTKVEETYRYGVVLFDENHLVYHFVEKPALFISPFINAGIYILDPSIINRIPLSPTSIEKDVFPELVKEQKLFTYEITEFWMDIGQPADYIKGTKLFLEYTYNDYGPPSIEEAGIFRSLIHETAQIGKDCLIVDSVVGKNVIIGDGVCIKDSVVLPGSEIKSRSAIEESIVGWNSKIGKWARLKRTVTGESGVVKDEGLMYSVKLLPFKSLQEKLSHEIVV